MWVVLDESRIRDLAGGDVRDLALVDGQSIWIATGTGVIHLKQGNPRLYNMAATADALPSDDIRALALGPGGKLYAGTAAGVGVFDQGTSTWTGILRTPGQLGNGDVRAIAVAADGTAYFGTADGLFRLAPDGTFTDFHAGRGLPSNDVRAARAARRWSRARRHDGGPRDRHGRGRRDQLHGGRLRRRPPRSRGPRHRPRRRWAHLGPQRRRRRRCSLN
jgi:hypothetical protein